MVKNTKLALLCTFIVACSDNNSHQDNLHVENGKYAVTIVSSEGGQLSPSSLSIDSNEQAEIQITPSEGFRLETISGCGGTLDATKFIIRNVNKHCTVKAQFNRNVYKINANSDSGGSIAPQLANVPYGQVFTFQIKAEAGYQLNKIEGCHGTLKDDTYIVNKVSSECTINASFSKKQYKVSYQVNNDDYGSINSHISTFSYGDKAEFVITPNKGYEIKDVKGCDGTLTKNVFRVGAIKEDCTISAELKPIGRFMLTFDDAYVESWLELAHPILADYDMKAVFYVTADYVIEKNKQSYVDALYKNGHIIGHHSCSHRFVESYEGDYIAEEVERCIDFYADYNLRHFAYPYGWAGLGKGDVEKKLKEKFDTVRYFNVGWVSETGPTTRPESATSIDGIVLKGNWEPVWKLLDKTRAEGTVAHLAAHGINQDCEKAKLGWRLCEQNLRAVIDYAHNLGLELGPPDSWF